MGPWIERLELVKLMASVLVGCISLAVAVNGKSSFLRQVMQANIV